MDEDGRPRDVRRLRQEIVNRWLLGEMSNSFDCARQQGDSIAGSVPRNPGMQPC